jgi:transcriptional antiterminator RfaH
VYTLPRNEKKVAERLQEKGYTVYCPLIKTLRQWSDRKKMITVPMFNSYVFINIDGTERVSVLKVHGIRNFVYWLGQPAIVKDYEIEAIRLISTEAEDIKVTNLKIAEGDTMCITEGPFKGLHGVVGEVNKSNVVLYIPQLGMKIQFKNTKRFLNASENIHANDLQN